MNTNLKLTMNNSWHEEKEIARNTQKTAIFMMGSGGSGKSYWLKNSMFSHLPVVNPDDFLPNPSIPTEGRAIAKAAANAKMLALVLSEQSFVRDTTGTNVARMVGEFEMVREAGYMIVLIKVEASLATCLARNQRRARTIPEDVLIADHEAAENAWQALRGTADVAYSVDNNGSKK